jgi:hypothetical protein
MNLYVFLPSGSLLRPRLERVFDAYPGLFTVRWHGPGDTELLTELLLASLPLDETTGHGTPTEPGSPSEGYGGYGYSGTVVGLVWPAIALYDRLALVDGGGGPPRRLRPGLWEASFQLDAALRPAFHRAVEDALAEVRGDHAALMALAAVRMDEADAASALGITREALRRALHR